MPMILNALVTTAWSRERCKAGAPAQRREQYSIRLRMKALYHLKNYSSSIQIFTKIEWVHPCHTPKFHLNPSTTFWDIPHTNKQKNKQQTNKQTGRQGWKHNLLLPSVAEANYTIKSRSPEWRQYWTRMNSEDRWGLPIEWATKSLFATANPGSQLSPWRFDTARLYELAMSWSDKWRARWVPSSWQAESWADVPQVRDIASQEGERMLR